MPKLVKLYKNLRDKELQHMLYKTKEGLQKEAFDYRDSYLSEHEYDVVFAIYNKETDEYFIIHGGYHSKHSIGE